MNKTDCVHLLAIRKEFLPRIPDYIRDAEQAGHKECARILQEYVQQMKEKKSMKR